VEILQQVPRLLGVVSAFKKKKKTTIYEAPHYEIFSIPIVLSLSQFQMDLFSSAPYCQTFSHLRERPISTPIQKLIRVIYLELTWQSVKIVIEIRIIILSKWDYYI
jgi:hypothetical protein